MQRAYILIETDVGQAADVAHRSARQRGVVHVELVTGPYDVIAMAEADSIAELHSGPFRCIDADLRVTRAVLCPVGHLVEQSETESTESEPLLIPVREPVLVGVDSDWSGSG